MAARDFRIGFLILACAYVLGCSRNTVNRGAEPGFGTLSLEVTPATATVFVDERLVVGGGPSHLLKVQAGIRTVKVEQAPLYLPVERTVVIAEGETLSVSIELEENQGSLHVSTVPSGAKVSIAERGQDANLKEEISPANIRLPPGHYLITITKGSMYDRITHEIDIARGQDIRWESVRLPPKYGELTVSTSPESARVYIDGRYRGKTPLSLVNVKPGRWHIRIESEHEIHNRRKYVPCDSTIVVTAGERTVVSTILPPNFGTLEIVTIPEGAEISISSKNRKIVARGVQTPATMDLPPGAYTVTLVKKPIYGAKTEYVLVTAGGNAGPVNIQLEPVKLLREEFVRVPQGKFVMGSEKGDSDEKPVREIELAEFWIKKHEVTTKEYAEFVYALDYRKPTGLENCNWDVPNRDKHPINCVSWNDAQAYIEWLSHNNEYGFEFRLPTEAEWEKAARGEGNLNYPFGDEWDGHKANFSDKNSPMMIKDGLVDDGFATTAPVGSYEDGRSYFGVYDMAGNVWEWTSSLHRPYPYDATDGREETGRSGERVVRGGAWDSVPEYLQSFIRSKKHQNDCSGNVGFRLVVSPSDNFHDRPD